MRFVNFQACRSCGTVWASCYWDDVKGELVYELPKYAADVAAREAEHWVDASPRSTTFKVRCDGKPEIFDVTPELEAMFRLGGKTAWEVWARS